MNKKARRIDYATAIPLFRKYGVLTFASVFFGFPGETYDSVMDTMSLIDESCPDFCRPLVWYCDTTTPIWKERDQYGIKGASFNWSHNTMNSRMAYDLMEDAFFRLRAPTVYVPDPGFNFISIYYLLQRGFSVEQVKQFLTAFTMAVKAKMLGDGRRTLPNPVLRRLMLSCDIAQGKVEADEELEQLYSSEFYRESCSYWVRQFQGYALQSRFLASVPATGNPFKKASFFCPSNEIELCCSRYSSRTLFAAFVYVLCWLEGSNTIAIIGRDEEGRAFPLCIRIDRNWRFRDLVNYVDSEWSMAQRFHLYSFYLLSNPYRLQQHQCGVPEFRYGFEECEGKVPVMLDKDKLGYRILSDRVSLRLNARIFPNRLASRTTIEYDPLALPTDRMRKMRQYVARVLTMSGRDADILLSGLHLIQPEDGLLLKQNWTTGRRFKF